MDDRSNVPLPEPTEAKVILEPAEANVVEVHVSPELPPPIIKNQGNPFDEEDQTLAKSPSTNPFDVDISPSTNPFDNDGPRMVRFPFKVKIIMNHDAESPNELTLDAGQVVTVLDQEKEGWYKGELVIGKSRTIGIFPIQVCNRI